MAFSFKITSFIGHLINLPPPEEISLKIFAPSFPALSKSGLNAICPPNFKYLNFL
jgi:hypothetical protein